MKDKTTIKQFDFTHLRVDEKLQGAKLASFTRRLLAYGLDWLIIVFCTQFLFLIIPLFLLLLLFKKKLHYTIIKSRRVIKRSVLMAGRKLEENTDLPPFYFWDFFNISGTEMPSPHTIKSLRR